MRKYITLFLCLLVINITTLAQLSVKFESRDTVKLAEKSTDTLYSITVKAKSIIQNDALKVKIRIVPGEGDATINIDFKLQQDSAELYFSKNSAPTASFNLLIKGDSKKDDDEYFKLSLECTDSLHMTVYDTLIVLIKDFQTMTATATANQTTNNESSNVDTAKYEKTFSYGDSLAFLKVREYGNKTEITVCKTNSSIDTANCKTATITGETTAELFNSYLSKLTKTSLSLNSNPVATLFNPTVANLYTAYKAEFEKKKTEKEKNKEEENIKKAVSEGNKKLEEKVDEMFKILKEKTDTASSDIAIKLDSIHLYTRRFIPKNFEDAKKINDILKSNNGSILKKKISCLDVITDTTAAYLYQKVGAETINIDSLSIRIENGYITSVVIFLDSMQEKRDSLKLSTVTVYRRFVDLRSSREVAENINCFIPLESVYKRFYYKFKDNDSLQMFTPKRINGNRTSESPNDIIYSPYFVNLSEIVRYFPRIDSIGDVLVHVKNSNLSFNKISKKSVRLNDKGFSSFAQLNIFSDVIGLTEDKPNGLIQVEGKFEAGLFTQPLFNSMYYSRYTFNLLPSVSLSVGITKIEDKLRYLYVQQDSLQFYDKKNKKHLPTDTNSTYRYANTLQLLQYSSMNVSAKANLVRFESDFMSFTGYVGFGIVRTPINDTTKGIDNNNDTIVSDNKTVINSLKTFYGMKFKIKSTSKLGVELGLEWIRLRLNSATIFQTYDYFDTEKKQNIIRQAKSRIFHPQIIIPNLNIYYFLDREQQNRFYIRSQYFIANNSRTDDFFSLQIGYSTDMKGLFDIFKKKE